MACDSLVGLWSILCRIQELLGTVLPVIIALGVVYLVYGIVTYFIGDSEEAKKKGRNTIIYGIIGLVVIISVWGLVAIIVDTFGVDADGHSLDYYGAPGVDNLLPDDDVNQP